MSQRLGFPVEALQASAVVVAVTNPTANAGVLVLPISQWCLLVSLQFQWVASATLGSRIISVLVKDSLNNVLWQTPPATALVPSTTLNGSVGGGVPSTNAAGPPITYTAPIPFDFPIPPGCTVEVIDTAAITITDTCSISAIVSG